MLYDPLMNLSRAERKLYDLLLENIGNLVTHKQIADELMDKCYHLPPDEYSHKYIMRLRKKIGKDRIITVRGKGYVLLPQ